MHVLWTHSQRAEVYTRLDHDAKLDRHKYEQCPPLFIPSQRRLLMMRPCYWDAQTIFHNLKWKNKSLCIWIWLRRACASCVGNIPGAVALVLNPDLSQGLLFLSPWSDAGGAGWVSWGCCSDYNSIIRVCICYRLDSVFVINKGEAAHFQADDMVKIHFITLPFQYNTVF